MTVSFVSSVTNEFSETTSGTVTYTTTDSTQIIVIEIASEGNSLGSPSGGQPFSVSTVTDTNGLTWNKRSEHHSSIQLYDGYGTGAIANLERWWAHSPTAQSGTITVTMEQEIDNCTMGATVYDGVYSVTAPWDEDSSVPAFSENISGGNSGFGTNDIPTVTINTEGAGLIMASLTVSSSQTTTEGSGATLNYNPRTGSGVAYCYLFGQYENFGSAQTGTAIALGQNISNYIYVVDALAGVAEVSGPSGTMASTEEPDTMFVTGYVPLQGPWASTENQDTWATSSGFVRLMVDPFSIVENSGLTYSTSGPDRIVLFVQYSTIVDEGSGSGPFGAALLDTVTDDAGLDWKPRLYDIAGIDENLDTMSISVWWAFAHDQVTDSVISFTNIGEGLNNQYHIFAVQGLNGNYGYPFGDQTNGFSLTAMLGGMTAPEFVDETEVSLKPAFYANGPLGVSAGPSSLANPVGATLSNSNDTVTGNGAATSYATSPDYVSGGRYYFEVTFTTIHNAGPPGYAAGVMYANADITTFLSDGSGGMLVCGNGDIYNGTLVANLGVTPANGDVIAIFINADSGEGWAADLTQSGYWNGSPSANPEFNAGGVLFNGMNTLSNDARSPNDANTGPVAGPAQSPLSPIGVPSGTTASAAMTFNFGGTSFAGTVVPGSFSGWPGTPTAGFTPSIYPSVILSYNLAVTAASFAPVGVPTGYCQEIAMSTDTGSQRGMACATGAGVQQESIPFNPSSFNYMDCGVTSSNWVLVLDTLEAGAVDPGSLYVTEAPDTMRLVGYPGDGGNPVGDLTCIENPDTMVFLGFERDSGVMFSTEFTDHFSAYGFQPLRGTFNTTEATDMMLAAGLGRGENGVWVSTETVDMFEADGYTPASAVWASIETADRFSAYADGATPPPVRKVTFVV